MSNPTINFRLSPYQLARGLQIIRQLEPDYQFTSISKMVKTIYLDYLAKMSLNKPDSIPQHYMDEIESMLYQPRRPVTNLQDFTQFYQPRAGEWKPKDEKSIKSTVEDFSPPKEWNE